MTFDQKHTLKDDSRDREWERQATKMDEKKINKESKREERESETPVSKVL
jgi:hypothetical protein